MMTAISYPFSKIINIDQGAREHYHVPKYQREYTWGWREWERLVQDIDENDSGYFMGSLICVRDGALESPGDELIYEVVDGQQRLTTLSLLMMAIYACLKDLDAASLYSDPDEQDDFRATLSSLRNKLVKKKKDHRDGEPGGFKDGKVMAFCRVQPSTQNHNLADYKERLGKLGLISEQPKMPHSGNRQIARALRYFEQTIPQSPAELLSLVRKINELNFVLISVNSQADAFTLFETLNNRGVPLSAIDIIKNKMLSEMERQHKVDIDESYEQWQQVIAAVPDASDQERFLRHFYHAFRFDPQIRVDGIPRAVKSKLIQVYEVLIKRNANAIFTKLIDSGRLYGALLEPNETTPRELADLLADFSRIGATPGYQLLLFLASLAAHQLAGADFNRRAIDLLCKYHVRRNVTDTPPTRTLDQAHIDVIEACQEIIQKNGRLTMEELQRELLGGRGTPATLEQFRAALNGPIYAANVGMARYLLCKLDSVHHTREYKPDLWARDEKEKFVWTIEHVLPQKENISNEWVQMIADGDRARADEIYDRCVDRLGNLTLSGYNSKLSFASLPKKQELAKDRSFLGHRINIGYRNGLALNALQFPLNGKKYSLADVPRWGEDAIQSRTAVIVDRLIELYRFPGEVG